MGPTKSYKTADAFQLKRAAEHPNSRLPGDAIYSNKLFIQLHQDIVVPMPSDWESQPRGEMKAQNGWRLFQVAQAERVLLNA